MGTWAQTGLRQETRNKDVIRLKTMILTMITKKA